MEQNDRCIIVIVAYFRNDGDRTPQEMVIDMQSDFERLSPAKPAMSPVRAPPVKSSPVRRAPAHGDSSEKRDRERKHREEQENVQLDKLQNIAEDLVKQKGDSPYSPSKDFSTSGQWSINHVCAMCY